jgi:aromatic-L-amino-acid decarboxylase
MDDASDMAWRDESTGADDLDAAVADLAHRFRDRRVRERGAPLHNVKALRTLGLGADVVRNVGVDDAFRLDVGLLAEAIACDRAAGVLPAIVIAHAGSPNTGAGDPLRAVADLCAAEGIWLHVDEAFGAFFRVCERTAPLVDGLELADSVTVDGHNGSTFRTGSDSRSCVTPTSIMRPLPGPPPITPAIGAGLDLHELGVEASRPWRGAAVWAALKHLGREGVSDLVSRCCALALDLAHRAEEDPRLELTAPVSCVTCFRYRPPGMKEGVELDDLNRRIQQRLALGGSVLAMGGMLPGGFSFRPAFVSWRTSKDDVAALTGAVVRSRRRAARPVLRCWDHEGLRADAGGLARWRRSRAPGSARSRAPPVRAACAHPESCRA